jgi:hypothetical protein
MKRLIYAEDVMQNVLDEIRYKESLYTSTVYFIIKKAIDAAQTIDPKSLRHSLRHKEEKKEWISVKDRLPDVFDEVLVYDTFSNTSISIAWRETTPRKNGIVDWYWNSQMSYPEDLTHVTHWMPLPKPPKETHND